MEGARRLVRQCSVQLVEMEESFGWARAVQGAIRVPVAVRLHGPFFLTGPAGGAVENDTALARVRAEGRAIAGAALVTAPAADVLQRVKAYFGEELPHARVVPNPVAPVEQERRWRLVHCDAKRILFVGRFDRLKGADIVVEAFARVLRQEPYARLTLVGPDGELAEGPHRWRLEAFVRDRLPGALESGKVEWLGRLENAALPDVRRRSLLTVVPSRYENFPYAVSEAMALGCPLVASRVGGIPEMVKDEINGLLHRPGDADHLAARLLELLRSPDRAAALGDRAGVDAERLLHPAVVARQLVELYEDAIERWPARIACG